MVARGVEPEATEDVPDRVVGMYGGDRPGPLLVVVGGMHGNEPAGVHAARAVLERLRKCDVPLQGRLIALAGNVAALETGARYLDEDLNRIWTEERVAQASDTPPASSEEREQRALLGELRGLLQEAEEVGTRLFLLDLHSTSAGGAPFSIMSDTVQNRRIGLAIPVPVILGLEERIEGTLLSWLSNRGHSALCVEGGRHDQVDTVGNHAAAIWIALEAAGLVEPQDVPDRTEHRLRLERASEGVPRVLEVRYHHLLAADEDFEMVPGHANFDRVASEQVLARSWRPRGGGIDGSAVRSPIDGLLLMPRYQALGEDGFFVGRPVLPFWLTLSAWLRRLPLQGVLRFLPGVRRVGQEPLVLRANPRVARWGTVKVFHLLGFRKSHRRDSHLYFVRRPDRFE